MDERWPGTLTAAVLICTRPRATIRAIVTSDPRRHVVPLALLGGLAGVLAPGGPPWGAVGVVAFAVLGLVFVWAVGFTFAVVGRLLGGAADAAAVRASLVWSNMPAILALGLYAGAALLLGREALETGFAARVADRFTALVSVWVWALGMVTLAEVHRFSLVRAFATAVVGSMAFAVPLMVVVGAAVVLGVDLRDAIGRVN